MESSLRFPAFPGPLKVGSLQLASRFLLSPLAGYTNLAFRLAIRELGGLGLASTDLISARTLLYSTSRTLELLHTCAADTPLAGQIYGTESAAMAQAARLLENQGLAVVDINMGCPVHKVVRGGAGSAMMCQPAKTISLVQAVVEAVRLPVTVKMRLGWDEESLTAPFFAREFEKAGVAAVTIHGRTRAQGFRGSVNRNGIRAVVEAVERMPVFGNGDVRTLADAAEMFHQTGCRGLSIGRGALLNPWIFSQLAHWEKTGHSTSPPSFFQHLDFMERHFHFLARQRGERLACLIFRKVANWYCKVLKPGKEIQQRLVFLAKVTDFDDIVSCIRQQGPPPNWKGKTDLHIPVPHGPVERW